MKIEHLKLPDTGINYLFSETEKFYHYSDIKLSLGILKYIQSSKHIKKSISKHVI